MFCLQYKGDHRQMQPTLIIHCAQCAERRNKVAIIYCLKSKEHTASCSTVDHHSQNLCSVFRYGRYSAARPLSVSLDLSIFHVCVTTTAANGGARWYRPFGFRGSGSVGICGRISCHSCICLVVQNQLYEYSDMSGYGFVVRLLRHESAIVRLTALPLHSHRRPFAGYISLSATLFLYYVRISTAAKKVMFYPAFVVRLSVCLLATSRRIFMKILPEM